MFAGNQGYGDFGRRWNPIKAVTNVVAAVTRPVAQVASVVIKPVATGMSKVVGTVLKPIAGLTGAVITTVTGKKLFKKTATTPQEMAAEAAGIQTYVDEFGVACDKDGYPLPPRALEKGEIWNREAGKIETIQKPLITQAQTQPTAIAPTGSQDPWTNPMAKPTLQTPLPVGTDLVWDVTQGRWMTQSTSAPSIASIVPSYNQGGGSGSYTPQAVQMTPEVDNMKNDAYYSQERMPTAEGTAVPTNFQQQQTEDDYVLPEGDFGGLGLDEDTVLLLNEAASTTGAQTKQAIAAGEKYVAAIQGKPNTTVGEVVPAKVDNSVPMWAWLALGGVALAMMTSTGKKSKR